MEKIGGEHVTVSALVRPGDSPHTYEPKPSQMSGLAQATLFFTAGVEFERAWLPRLRQALKTVRIVHTDSGIAKIAMLSHHDLEDNHLQTGITREESEQDPHIWLSPALVKQQAATICTALVGVDPGHAGDYRTNGQTFSAQIKALQDSIRQILRNTPHKKFLVFHPSWGYFAREFGLVQIPIEIAGREPKPAELEKIIALVKNENIATVFIQPQFSATTARVLAGQLRLRIVVADDLAEDWADNLLAVAKEIGAP